MNEREAHEKAASGVTSFGHYLLRRAVEEMDERRRIVVELCSAAADGGSISTQDVERILTQHGVEFTDPGCTDAIRDWINSI